ncbi:hypothetical protein AX16_003441 [Volvariella volvacea WC 439]|nr:hypothetical protein AX16_003441 [Volvariella volvacea WC 439]
MLYDLPAELLQSILSELGDDDLCSLAALCRSLHIHSLNELFTRNEVFKPSSESVPKPPISSSIGQYYSSTGTLIVLTNKATLFGLRLALPCVFEGLHITGLSYIFANAPFARLRKEMKGLGRFLAESPAAPTIEGIILDFGHITSHFDPDQYRHSGYSPRFAKQNTIALRSLLNIFNRDTIRKRLRCLVSLSILNGDLRDGISSYYHIVKPAWTRSGSNLANLTQTLTTIASIPIFPRSHTTGLRTLNLHSMFVFYDCFINWTYDFLGQHTHTLRSLSFHNVRLVEHHWPTVLSHITLPNLEELYLGQSSLPIRPLTSFLVRHRSLKLLDLGSNVRAQLDPWKRPPFFLPQLMTLKGTPTTLGLLLHPKLGSSLSSPLPSLRSVTLTLFSPYTSPTQSSEYHPPIERLNSHFLTLQVYMGTQALKWLRGDDESTKPYEEAIGIEFILSDFSQFLETEGVRLGLAGWLSRFRALSRVEFVGCTPMTPHNRTARQVLFRGIKAKNQGVESIFIDSIQVL